MPSYIKVGNRYPCVLYRPYITARRLYRVFSAECVRLLTLRRHISKHRLSVGASSSSFLPAPPESEFLDSACHGTFYCSSQNFRVSRYHVERTSANIEAADYTTAGCPALHTPYLSSSGLKPPIFHGKLVQRDQYTVTCFVRS
ncbi:uncharacterized protein ARMOST_04973 [Armillaria ostoyae]|uniref:Uncharacterized protein n=1 Tax=Armillaria ostoyae TaxID=47428 RepID=A0A284QYV4_ARMOS|nr:uncharacterized protein ARMOST_04973 [Armillaria ostoyae]